MRSVDSTSSYYSSRSLYASSPRHATVNRRDQSLMWGFVIGLLLLGLLLANGGF